MTQETTPQVAEVDAGISEEQAASEILKKMGVGNEPPAEEQPQEDAPEQEPEEGKPESEDEPEGEPEESEDVEIDVAGEKFKLPAALKEVATTVEAKVKEIEAGATRKFQEAAETRKVAEAQLEQAKAIAQVSEQELDLLANQRTIQARLQQILSIDSNALAEQDPVTLTKLNAELMRLQAANQQIDAALQQTRSTRKQKEDEAVGLRLNHLADWSKKNIPGWSDDYSQTLFEFSVKELGADPQALRNVMSEPVLKALHLAYKGWKVQTTDPKTKQVQSTKTLKPGGSGQSKTQAQQAVETANRRLGQLKNVDSAAAALLARANAKRR
jgi:ABC-type transporter Mla MlaB component